MNAGAAAAAHAALASDTDLVRAVRMYGDEAFEELYRRYREPIARFVGSLIQDDGRAEDVAQEAFVSALRRIRQTDCEIRFKPWIYEIARNAAIDHHRRSSRAEEVPFGPDAGPTVAASTPCAAPEASFLEKERLDHLRGALDELSETAQRIVVLRELEGLSYREIGQRMQLSPAAVESALFRARRKLEHEYEQIDTGRRCALMRALIVRMAEGVDSGRDRSRLDRHVRRCWGCRRRAHELGLRPARPAPRARRAGAFLPFPALLHRLGMGARSGSPAGRDAAAILSTPGAENIAQDVHKAVIVLASAIAIGSGGATLGGVGPLAPDGGDTAGEQPGAAGERQSAQRAAREERSATGSPAHGGERASGGNRGDDGPGSSAPDAPSSPSPASDAPAAPAGEAPAAGAQGQRAPGVGEPALPQGPGSTAPLEPALPSLPAAPALPDATTLLPEVPEVADGGLLPREGLVPDTSEVTTQVGGPLPPP